MSTSAPAAIIPQVQTKAISDARAGLRLGIGMVLTSLVLLIFVQYALPPGARAHYWGLNPEGMLHFRSHWGLSWLPTLGTDSYSLAFRLLLVTLWSGYALAVLSAKQGAELNPRLVLLLIIATALVTALFAPPLLSHDVYAYAAHGRLAALYGLNPYFHLPSFLGHVHDPAAAYVTWNWPTVYGPVWTRIETALVSMLRGQGLWAQVIGLKLIEAVALIGAASAGRRIAEKLSPGKENLTLLAIGLNPLLLLEGPGSGHNDLLMVCLLLVGAMFYVEKKYVWAALLLGGSVGIKLITLAVLPWAWMEWARGRPWRERIVGGIASFLLTLLPTMICYVGLWHGGATLAALHARTFYNLSAAAQQENAAIAGWLLHHNVGGSATGFLVTLAQNRLVLGTFAILTVWLALKHRPAQWLSAWAIFALILMLCAMGLPFPWYICWFWTVCLLRWDRIGMGLSTVCFGLSLLWVSGYAVVSGY
jgi:hypothetical protein